MSEKEAKRLAKLAAKVARNKANPNIYYKGVSFGEKDLELIKNNQEEFIDALNEQEKIGHVQYPDSLIEDIVNEGSIWFEV